MKEISFQELSAWLRDWNDALSDSCDFTPSIHAAVTRLTSSYANGVSEAKGLLSRLSGDKKVFAVKYSMIEVIRLISSVAEQNRHDLVKARIHIKTLERRLSSFTPPESFPFRFRKHVTEEESIASCLVNHTEK
jgi:hypothetical protein